MYDVWTQVPVVISENVGMKFCSENNYQSISTVLRAINLGYEDATKITITGEQRVAYRRQSS